MKFGVFFKDRLPRSRKGYGVYAHRIADLGQLTPMQRKARMAEKVRAALADE